MLIVPAIDLQRGACVRLSQGRFDAVTDYGDPFARLRDFAAAGATWVHIVDLDGARSKSPAQYDLIGRLAAEAQLRVQSGGGIRSREHVAALLDAGVARVVIGSVAARDPMLVREWIAEFGSERICVAFDVRRIGGGWEVVADGWATETQRGLFDVLTEYPPGVLKHILVTDVSRDGMLAGPNVALMQLLCKTRPDLTFQASGGVSELEDVATLRAAGAGGAIIGRALYEGRFTLEAALAL